MAQRTEQVTVYTCDACGKQQFEAEGDDPLPGVRLTGYVVDDRGGRPVEVFSCSAAASHVGKAFVNAHAAAS